MTPDEVREILLRMLLEAPIEGGKALEVLGGKPTNMLRGSGYINYVVNGGAKPTTWYVTQKGLDFIKGE